MANEDHDQIKVTLQVVETHAARLLPETQAHAIRDLVAELMDALFPANGTPAFHDAQVLCERVKSRLQASLTLVPVSEAQALRVGMRLGSANHMDELSEDDTDQLVASVLGILSPDAEIRLADKFHLIKQESSYRRGNRLFNLALRELTRQAAG